MPNLAAFLQGQILISVLGMSTGLIRRRQQLVPVSKLLNTETLKTQCKHLAAMGSSKQSCKTLKMKVVDAHLAGEVSTKKQSVYS